MGWKGTSVTAMQIRAVIFKEGDSWVGQCLEHDIGVQAADLDSVQFRLALAIEIERDESFNRNGAPFAGIPPAPRAYHQMWDESAGTFTPKNPAPIRPNGFPVDLDLKVAA